MAKIGIVGATGMIGKPVTNAFIQAGFEVTVLVRNIEKAKRLFGNNVHYMRGDVRNIAEIKRFITGLEYLYLNLSVAKDSAEDDFQPERDGMVNIIAVAKESSVKRIGYLSSLVHLYEGQNGFHWWAFELKSRAVHKIRAAGIPYSIFYPSTFMESFDKGAYRQGNFIALAGVSKFKMFLIAAGDYGKQVVKAFELNNGNQEFVIQGEEGFTADEAANFYKKHCSKTQLMVVKAPLFLLKLAGKFSNKFAYGAKIIEALNNYPEKFEADKVWNILGKPHTKFIDYINAG
ncbi:MAG: NmrA family NAD(P)-binding protein [Chitinophagaceae bacterium]|nr:NmrA family NAD(P)-binding protein [Chitinophagaceae bacterium]